MNWKRMRLFDEWGRIKHSSRLMHPMKFLCALPALCLALNAAAQQPPTATPAAGTTTATNQSATVLRDLTRKTRVLSLPDCISLALQHNFDIQIQRYNPQIEQYALRSLYGAYDPTLTLTAAKSYNGSPGGLVSTTNGTFIATGTERESDTYTPDLKGVLPSGLTYELNGSWSRNSVRPAGFDSWLPPTWSADPGITLDQPLLKNFWIDNTRLQIRLNKAALKISEQALRLQIMTTVTAVKTAYYNLLYARGNIDANATALKLAQQLVSENQKRVEVGSLAPLDEKQSESQAAASLAALQAGEQALLVNENTLKNLLTDSYAEWADVSPVPSEQLVAVPQQLDLQESWRRAVVQRPELIEAKLNVEKQNITLKYTFNQMFPQLDVTGSYGRNAFNTSLDNSFTDLRTGANSFYSYGAYVSIPLGNTGARNNHTSAKLTLKQLLLQMKQQEQTILVQVDNDVGQVRSTLQQVDATRAARVYAEDALAAERLKLEKGKSTSFIVLQLISTLTTARVNEVQALANYNIAVAQLSLDTGNTFEDNRIDMKGK
jgi:outer membrane protein